MRKTIYLDDGFYKRLTEMAARKGITISALIKLACSEYMEKEDVKSQSYKLNESI